MLKKKQYYLSLIGGIVAFLLFFIGAYLIVSLQMPKPQTGTAVTKNEQSTNTLVEVKEDVPHVEIYTKITLQTIDEGRKIIDRLPIAATTLLGEDEKSIKKHFADCEILKFSEREVVLQKMIKQTEKTNVKDRYKLGINTEEQACIIDNEDENNMIVLTLSTQELSPQEYSKLLKGITISEKQKEALMQSQNEIYKILQGYEQD